METTWVHAQTRHALLDPTVTRWPGRRRAESQVALKRIDRRREFQAAQAPADPGVVGRVPQGRVRLGFLRPEGSAPGSRPHLRG